MSRIFWDTNLFIYLIEDCGELSRRTIEITRAIRSRNDLVFTSYLSLGEALVKPLEQGTSPLVERFKDVLLRRTHLVDFDRDAALLYARVRSDRSIKPSDAIQLACAAKIEADLFITNDERLSKAIVREIKFITSLQRCPL